MSLIHVRSRRLLAVAFTLTALILFAGASQPVGAQRGPDAPELPADVLRLAEEIQALPEVRSEPDVSPPLEPADPAHPAVGLRSARSQVAGLIDRGADRRALRNLETAREALGVAWRAYSGGSDDLSHLRGTADAMAEAAQQLDRAARMSSHAERAEIAAVQGLLADVSERMASAMLRRAESAGVSHGTLRAAQRRFELGRRAVDEGRYSIGVAHMGGAMWLAGNTVEFDVALFEDNISAALGGNTVGHAFSIAWKGQLYEGGEANGFARTVGDLPVTAQSPSKEMHVASVSKPLTTIVILRLLEQRGLTPDAKVAPWLPSDWALGDGVGELRFRDFMKHESGFGQIGAGSSYFDLRGAIATDVGATDFDYSNANFGLMRVVAAQLRGYDMGALPIFFQSAIASSLFLDYAQDLYASIGVSVDCRITDPNPTIHYNLPAGLASGYLEPDRRQSCGGFGWHVSSNELASVMANLRQTENLISNEMRAEMEDDFLGWMDPANYGWINGDFGVYHMHGGDWFHGEGEAHACAITFPIQVQAGLVINSERGGGMQYQCNLLEIAFDDAWVSK